MSIQSFPHNSTVAVSRGVAEAGWRRFGRLMLSPGVVDGVGGELQVSAAGGTREVQVASGELFVEGFILQVSSVQTLVVPDADPDDPRIDGVFARYEPEGFSTAPDPSGLVSLVVRSGVAAAVPVAPEPVEDPAADYEVPLAFVDVAAGSAFVDPGDLQDARVFASQVRDLSGPTAERLATTAVAVGTRWFDTDLALEFRWTGSDWLALGAVPDETAIIFAIALGG